MKQITESKISNTENRKPKTETRNPKTENRKPKTENRNPKTVTRNRNPKTETRNPKPEILKIENETKTEIRNIIVASMKRKHTVVVFQEYRLLEFLGGHSNPLSGPSI